VARDWLLITVSTPPGGTSTLRVYAWRKLRSLGAHYLRQSVCLLPATPRTSRAAARLVTRLRAEGGHGEMLRIQLTDPAQEAAVIDAIRRERTDDLHRARGVRRRPRPASEVAGRNPSAGLLRCARRSRGRRRRRLLRRRARPLRGRSTVRGAWRRRARRSAPRRRGLMAPDIADRRRGSRGRSWLIAVCIAGRQRVLLTPGTRPVTVPDVVA
jgi:hypothetical protein